MVLHIVCGFGGGGEAWQNQLEAEGKSKDDSLRDGSSTQGEHTL